MAVKSVSPQSPLQQFQNLVAARQNETQQLIETIQTHPEFSQDGETLEVRIEKTYQAALKFDPSAVKDSLYQLNAARCALVETGIGMSYLLVTEYYVNCLGVTCIFNIA